MTTSTLLSQVLGAIAETQAQPSSVGDSDALQAEQRAALDAMYDTLSDISDRQHPDCVAAVARYDASVAALESLLGVDAHCNQVDADLWGLYSDCFKSENGFRPRHHVTRAAAKDYLAQRS